MKKNLLLSLVFVLLALLTGELLLRLAGVYASYGEKSELGKYISPFDVQSHGWFRIYTPHSKISWKNTEFTHSINSNSEGLNDREWTVAKSAGTQKRIAFFGDSFTEGVGASPDSSFPDILQSTADTVEIMNCGVAGSDPVFEYMLFKEKILKYHPDEIFVCLIQTDVWDIQARGGFERFKQDGTLHQPQHPWFEGIYEKSYIFRLFVHKMLGMNRQFIFPADEEAEDKKAIDCMKDCMGRFDSLCIRHHVKCNFVFLPSYGEVTQRSFRLQELLHYSTARYKTLDLFRFCRDNGMNAETMNEFYWAKDTHPRNKGYALFAKGLLPFI